MESLRMHGNKKFIDKAGNVNGYYRFATEPVDEEDAENRFLMFTELF